MKKTFLILITLAIAFGGFSQNTKRPGYNAKSNTFRFDKSKTNIPMPGYYILKDGTSVEAIIAYRKPEFFVGDFAAAASLLICKELTGKPMDVFNPDNEPNFKAYIKKEDLKAFFVAGHLYANIENVGWRIVLNEGAIHNFLQVVKVNQNGREKYIVYDRKQWFQDEPEGSALMSISSKNHLAMLEKIPPSVQKGKTPEAILTDVKNNKISLQEAEIRYNIWFNNNSEMQIDYILGEEGLSPKEKAIQAEKDRIEAEKKKYEAEVKFLDDAKKNAHRASEQDHFKGRSTTVDESIASVTPEVPVKKEKFYARIQRIKAEGNKVGVLVQCSNRDVNPQSHTVFSNQKAQRVWGSYGPIKGIEEIGEKAVEAFNKGFETDVFELIDMKQIPFKYDGRGGKEDDWWATKYKLLIVYRYNPYYIAYIETTGEGENKKTNFKGQMFVKSFIYIEAAEEGRSRLKSMRKTPRIASYASNPYLGDPSTKIYMIQELKALVKPWTDEQIVEHLLKFQSKYNAKFIKKTKK